MPSATELRDKAEAALGSLTPGARLTPALPAAWPDAGGKVVYLACLREPLPTSLASDVVHAPSDEVEVDVASGATRHTALPARSPLGEEQRALPGDGPPDADELARAEQALVDVVAGRRPADGARGDLAPYGRWLAAEALLAGDLRGRFGAFFEWVKA
jgi:hypothetical protein